jgi:hypothetical protein
VSTRTASWLAWSLCVVCLALIGLALLLDFLTGEVIPAGVPGERPGFAFAVLTGVLSLAFPTVGALIASKLPTNPIGWHVPERRPGGLAAALFTRPSNAASRKYLCICAILSMLPLTVCT